MSSYGGGGPQVSTPLGPSRKRKDRDDKAGSLDPTPPRDNRLLAGYLAHEFLTRGTLLGRPWDEAAASEDGKPPETAPPPPLAKRVAYTEMARLLMNGGAHVPDVVNPAQLASWLRI